jgi:hypothetical protein
MAKPRPRRRVEHALLPVVQEAYEDILAYRHLPLEHQRQLHSTNPLERLNKEIKRRSNVVGIFPNPASVIRLVGALRLERDDEWAVADRRNFSADSMKQLTTPALSTTAQEILAAIASTITNSRTSRLNFHHLTGHYRASGNRSTTSLAPSSSPALRNGYWSTNTGEGTSRLENDLKLRAGPVSIIAG